MPVANPAPLNFFANYTQRPARVSVAVWWALRVVVLLTVLAWALTVLSAHCERRWRKPMR